MGVGKISRDPRVEEVGRQWTTGAEAGSRKMPAS